MSKSKNKKVIDTNELKNTEATMSEVLAADDTVYNTEDVTEDAINVTSEEATDTEEAVEEVTDTGTEDTTVDANVEEAPVEEVKSKEDSEPATDTKEETAEPDAVVEEAPVEEVPKVSDKVVEGDVRLAVDSNKSVEDNIKSLKANRKFHSPYAVDDNNNVIIATVPESEVRKTQKMFLAYGIRTKIV